MSDENQGEAPTAQEELKLDKMTEEGKRRKATDAGPDSGTHMGAVDGETTPVRPPMAGPADLIGEDDADDDLIDPRDELTPG